MYFHWTSGKLKVVNPLRRVESYQHPYSRGRIQHGASWAESRAHHYWRKYYGSPHRAPAKIFFLLYVDGKGFSFI